MSRVSLSLRPEGSLARHDFPDLVQALYERRWSGVLTLSHMGVGKVVTVHEGRMVFASSTSRDERLGELLLRRGRITLRQFVEAGRGITPGKRLGTVLVERGILPPKDLVRAVLEHTQEILYGAFQWVEGHYVLQEHVAAPETIQLKLSTPDIIIEGIRRIESWTRIERALGGIEARYVRAQQTEPILADTTLAPEKVDLLEDLGVERDLGGLCDSCPLPDFEVCQTLWAFRVIGLVRRVDVPADAAVSEDDGLGLMFAEE